MSPHMDVENEEVGKYRGFTLGSSMEMMFMRVLARRLHWLAEDRILTEAQGGFRSIW